MYIPPIIVHHIIHSDGDTQGAFYIYVATSHSMIRQKDTEIGGKHTHQKQGWFGSSQTNH